MQRPRRLPLLLLLGALLPGTAAAQQDALRRDSLVTVVPGPSYAAGGLKARLLGDDYRDLWTTPIRVPLLDLQRYAGGLQPVERGGGLQTKVLHLRSTEGLEFVFRSVDKEPSLMREPAVRDTWIAEIVQDQVSALNPAAAAVVPPILDAVGVLHATPRLVVMPDDPALGEFREDFAGVLGWIEARPDEIAGEEEDRPGWGGFSRITGTEALLERLEESPEDRIDARAYLTARLTDFFLGDWDRHADQWRWAEQELDGRSVWIPIPRDRDFAFVDYDGWFMRVGRRFVPNAITFTPNIRQLGGLTLNARQLDRRLLAGVELAAWDSIAGWVQAQLTDSVIDLAVRRMPPEFVALRGEELARTLKSRRADIPEAARAYYETLAEAVEVRGTDERDLAVVERTADDVVEVRLYPRSGDSLTPEGEPYYRRRFYRAETSEVRLFLHGGDDYAVVRGAVDRSLKVRVVGGGGDDVLVDSSVVRLEGTETVLHDARGDDEFVRTRHTRVDTRGWEDPQPRRTLSGVGWRDTGSTLGWAPVLGYRGTDGLIVGGGPTYTRYGFRAYPYKYRVGGRVMAALGSWNVAAEAFGEVRRSNSPRVYSAYLLGTQLENFRFYGYGNDTERAAREDLYLVKQDQVLARAGVGYLLPRGGRIDVGPVFKYTNPDVPEGSPLGELPRYGNDGFSQLGAWAQAVLDRRGDVDYPRSGFRVAAEAQAFPGVIDATGAFGSASLEGRTYLTAPGVPATLALRGGGQKVWGDFPVHEAAFLGGSRTVRGQRFQRYAGDALLFGGAELRAPLFPALLLVRGTVGGLLLADAGRVYYEGESEGGWHTAVGGGLWFHFQIRDDWYAASATDAQGEEGRVYLKLGVPF